MPGGPLCSACYAQAKRRLGACAICATTRLLPGIDTAGRPTCCSCAGIRHNYTCSRCGIEWAIRNGICEWCWLADDLDSLLAGPVDLAPLREPRLSAPRPDSIIIWLYSPTVRALLRDLAGGTIAILPPSPRCIHTASLSGSPSRTPRQLCDPSDPRLSAGSFRQAGHRPHRQAGGNQGQP
jgi:hypothetical protein